MALDPRLIKGFSTAIFDTVLANLGDTITGVSGGLINLSAWSASLRADATAALNNAAAATAQAVTAQTTASTAYGIATSATTLATTAQATGTNAQASADTAASQAAANESAIIAAQNQLSTTALALITKANASDVPKNVPSWFSLNPLEDVSFPRMDIDNAIANVKTGSYGSVGGDLFGGQMQCGAGGQDGSDTYIGFYAGGTFTPASGAQQFVFINATRDRIYNTVGVLTGVGSVASPAALYISVFKMDKDATTGLPNGNLTRLYLSPDQSSLVTSAAQDVRINLPSDIVAKAGDWFAVGILQVTAAGKTLRSLSCKVTKALSAVPGLNPSKPVMTITGLTSTPSTVAKASLDTSSTTVPWVCLGQTSGLVKADYPDLFDRADGSTLGPNWANYGPGTIGIKSNDAAPGVNPPSNGGGSTNVWSEGAIWSTPLATDSMSVASSLAGLTNPQTSYLVARSNGAMTSYVAVGIAPSTLTIVTGAGINDSDRTVRATLSTTILTGDLIDLHAVGNTYTVYQNGTPVLTWTDSGGIVPIGASNRYAGMIINAVCYDPNFFRPYQYWSSVWFRDWEAKDL